MQQYHCACFVISQHVENVRKMVPGSYICWLQVVTIDRERLISEKQNNMASPTSAELPKEAMLMREIFKFSKPSLDAFRPFRLISRACQGPRKCNKCMQSLA